MAIKAIKRENICDQVFEQLKQQLLTGEWKQGDKIPSENELSAAFGVSRVTIRQALQKLTMLGLIETKLGEGSYVKELSPGIFMNAMVPLVYLGKNAINEVMEFRSIIEVETAAIAALKITAKGIRKLEKSYEQMEINSKDLSKYVKYDMEFHAELAITTGNSLIVQLYDILSDILNITIKDVTKQMGTDIGLKYHGLLIQCMKNHDSKMAKETMKSHIQEAQEIFNQKDV